MTSKIKFPLLLGLALLAVGNVQAQSELWGGLDKPQSPEELPAGRAAFQRAQRVAKQPSRPSALVAADAEDGAGVGFTIFGGWELTDGATAAAAGDIHSAGLDTSRGWFDAAVPGTVLTTLVAQGVYPDPYFGLNNLSIPDSLARTDWWYRTAFTAPAAKAPHTWLCLDGINYRAEVFLNGTSVGTMAGAFARGRFDVSSLIKTGAENVLAVHIFPPTHPGIPHEQTMKAGQGLNGGQLSLDGPTFISSVGWDWIPGIRDRNVGLWQAVRLEQTGGVVVEDPFVVADLPLPDTTRVRLSVRVPLKNNAPTAASGTATVSVGGAVCDIPYTLAAGEAREFATALELRNPALWWPNGYGETALNTARIAVKDADGNVSHEQDVTFGIREFAYELMVQLPDGSHRRVLHTPTDASDHTPAFDYVKRGQFTREIGLPTLAGVTDMSQVEGFMARHGLTALPDGDPVGPYLALRVNGRRVFCRGGNWGMDDGMKRVSEERLAPYFELHRRAGFNMIRNWTGESTEEAFYALCDRYGIMVWNDFWITTDDTVEPLDAALFLANAADAVKRFRNHPSIAVWCPRNEGFAPANLERELPPMMAALDPTRHYHGQSRLLNMDTSGPWSYFEDPSVYYTKNAKGFLTEIGTFAIPTAQSIRKFIAEEDLWPINDVWAYHDLHHTSQNFAGFMKAVARYGEPTSMEDFERKAQLVCYDAWRAIMESWNSRMWNTATGQLLWMSHPAWPSMIWQTHTWDYQTPGSYFGAKKASEPLHIQFNLGDSTVMVINNTLRAERGLTARVSYIDPVSGRVLRAKKHSVYAAAGGTTTVTRATPSMIKMPALHILRVELMRGQKTLSTNDYWRAADAAAYAAVNSIPTARVATSYSLPRKAAEPADGLRHIKVTVKNTSPSVAVNVKLDAVNKRGEEILPAYFADGYFNLLPGESRVVEASIPANEKTFTIVASGYNLDKTIVIYN